MDEMSFGGSDVVALEREASEFAWDEGPSDMAMLQRFAEEYAPDGTFNVVESFEVDAADEPEANVRVKLSPVLVRWLQWLEDKYDRHTAIVISAGAFAAVHFQQPHVVLALFFFGVLLGYAYERTGSLAAPVLIHAAFNLKTLVWESVGFTV